MTPPSNVPTAAFCVTAVQWRPGADPAANLRAIAAHVARASAAGSTLIVFPEYAQRHVAPPSSEWTASHESVDGPWVTALTRIALDNAVTIIAGMIETNGSEKPFNTQVVVNEVGVVTASRKIHLYDAFSVTESDLFSPAPHHAADVFTLAGMSVGVQTCYDLRYPEVTRRLVDAGADVVAVPAQWVPGPHKLDQWVTLCRARAIEAQVWVVAADHPAPTGVGASLIVSPQGEIVAQADKSETTIAHTLNRDLVARVRDDNPMAMMRRFAVTWG